MELLEQGLGASHISARCGRDRKRRAVEAANSLGVTVTDLITSAVDAFSGRVISGGWECRRVHLVGSRIVGIGEAPPRIDDGAPLLAMTFAVVAPRRFWELLEVELGLSSPSQSSS